MESVPDGGSVTVVPAEPVLIPVIVVNGPVKVPFEVTELGLGTPEPPAVVWAEPPDEACPDPEDAVGPITITVPVPSVPDGRIVRVVAGDLPELVEEGLEPGDVGSITMTVPTPPVPEGGSVRVVA